MFRKRKQPTPNFKLLPPFNPITGDRAGLNQPGVFPYVAMMQVAAEDTERDYVLCRGFDVRISRFIDYEAGNADKPGIPVAKPYGKRYAGAYSIGQVFPAILPLQSGNPSPTSVLWRVGQNPGVASVTLGHPASLSEEVEALKDTGDAYINWQLIDEGDRLVECCLAEDHPGRGTPFDVLRGKWDPSTDSYDYSTSATVKAIDWRYGVPYPDGGAKGEFYPRVSDTYGVIYVCVSLDCESPGECGD